MKDNFKKFSEDLRKDVERHMPEKANIMSNFLRPLFYFKIRRILNKLEWKIKEIDSSYILPKMKIRLTFKEEVNASISVDIKKGTVLRVNIHLRNRKMKGILERSIAHELMHLWIGFDLPNGKTMNLPQYEPLIKNIGFYRGKNYTLRYKLCCFLYQQVALGKVGQKMMHVEGYDDIWFRKGKNPFVNFEEMLVMYATIKLFNDPLGVYIPIKKAFDEDYDDKKLLLFIDKEMPNIRLAIEKLVNEF